MKKLSKLLALIVALCLVLSVGVFASGEPSQEPSQEPSGEASGEAQSAEDAFIDYIHEWLLAELEVNSNMTIEQVEDEFMPLVEQMNFVDFPAEMIYSGMLEQGVPMTFDEFAAQYVPAAGAGGYTADELAELEASLPAKEKAVREANQALSDCDNRIQALNAELEEKQTLLDNMDESDTSTRISATKARIEALNVRIEAAQAEVDEFDKLLSGDSEALEQGQALLSSIDEQIDALKQSDTYKALALLADTDSLNSQYAAALEGKAQLEAGIAQIDTMISKLESGIIPGGFIDGVDEDMDLNSARATIRKARKTALSAFADAESQINESAKTLAESRKTFEESRDEALKNAGLDGVITVQTVAGLIGGQNISMPAGYVYDLESDAWLVRVGDKFTSLKELRGMKLFSIGGEKVDVVRLEDVASVEITDNSADNFTKVDGRDGILLSIEKQSTFSTTDVSSRVAAKSAQLMGDVEGLSIVEMFNQGDYINIVVQSVLENLVYGGLLAILVLLIFLLDWRPTFIVALSIPLSVVITFVCMYFSGITLNVLSLAGLALGIGMLVDNSIVAIENIFRLRNEKGMPLLHACVEGVRQVSGSLFASTLTTICVFLPIVFITGLAHDLFKDLGLTITFSLLASLLVAMTVVPSMAASLMKKTRRSRENGLFMRIQNGYTKLLRGALRIKPLVLLAAIALLAFSIQQIPSMGLSFMPEVSSTQMTATLSLNDEEDTSIQQERALSIMEHMMDISDIQSIGLTSGGTLSALSSGGSNLTYYIILQENAEHSNADIAKDIRAIGEEFGTELSVQTSTMDISILTGSGITANIYGDNLDTLQTIAKDVAEIARNVEGTAEVDDGLESAVPEMRIVVDKEKARDNNLTVGQVLQFVATKLSGKVKITSAELDGKNLSIYLIDDRNGDITPETLADLTTEVTSGDRSDMVRIGDIADIEETQSLSTIRRSDQKRTHSVTFAIAEGYSANLVSDDFEARLRDYSVPAGYSVSLAGENETVMAIMKDLVWMVLIAVLLIFLIMVAQFQSFKSPIIVMFTIPLAFTGGLLALIFTGMDLSIVSMLGFLVLSGVVVNNGNRVECAFGYATLYGDSIGALAPIADLTKTKLFQLARAINGQPGVGIIPENLLPRETDDGYDWEIMPSAELSDGQRDPMKWFYHDWLVENIIDDAGFSIEDLMAAYLEDKLASTEVSKWVRFYGLDNPQTFIDDLEWVMRQIRISVFKRVQAPPTIITVRSTYSYDFRENQAQFETTDRYRELKAQILAMA